MDRDNNVTRDVNPRQTSKLFSLVTFFYTIKLFITGYTRGLELDDIYEVSHDSRSKLLGEKLEHHWQKEKEKSKSPSVCRALLFTFGKPFILTGLIQFVTTMVITTWSPEALSKLIAYFTPGQTNLSKQDAVFYGCLVVGINWINILVKHNLNLLLTLLGVKAKAAVSSLLYRKALKLKSEALSDVTTGKIVTVISKDVDVLEASFDCAVTVCIAFVKSGLICYLVYRKIGVSSLPGITFFFVIMPLQVFIGTLTYKYKLKCSKKTDERLDLIRDVLAAGKIIKMYTWERFFENKIHSARKNISQKELHKLFYTQVWISIIGSICSKVAFFIFIMTYACMGHDVTAATVYYILSCCTDLQNSLSDEIPFGFSIFAQIFATAKRIESVLEAQEVVPKREVRFQSPKIVFEGVDVKMFGTKILEGVSMSISEGFYVVLGHVGSGKTTFLRAILGECETNGYVNVTGRFSYASQESWLFPSTIRNNILFGEEYNEKRYRQVLKICSLDYDLDLFADGDNTVVAESGINLSKGQQARINLARTIYKDSDMYLLDDCLASLDANVSDKVFAECICKFLNGKIRIFVTNRTNYVEKADKVIVVNSKSIKLSDACKDTNVSYSNTDDKNGDNENNETKTWEKPVKPVYHEDKKSGRVPFGHYVKYIEHGGGLLLFSFILGVFALAQFASSYSDKLLSKWVTVEQNLTTYKESNFTVSQDYDNLYAQSTYELGSYTIITGTSILLLLISSFSYFYFIRMASNNLHKSMVHTIINSTMKFFDSHFIGNVINRCTKDYVTLDDTLPFVAADCFMMIFTAFGTVVVLSTVSYIFLLESLVLLIASCLLKQFCQPTERNLERLHVVARSPLTGHLNATLEGLTTIRTSNAQTIVKSEFDRHQDLFTSALTMLVTNFAALRVFSKYICMVFTTVVIFQFLLFDMGTSVGDVGLAITQAFMITKIVSTGIISVADIENLMISVERILEYTELEQEDKNGKVLLGWPKLASISFRNVSLNYRSSKILKNINFTVNENTKLGIVGRTGAGKSSLIAALLRLYEAEGTISIDGVDIRGVSLDWLRSNISIIPQDPYLFPGTLRENLDPLKRYTDEEIWTVLKSLQLDKLIDDLYLVVNKALFFSSGQKQLLCLVRAILSKNKIVVLDEATANVDDETDDLMQNTIQSNFGNCTLIIIAHKLELVMKCDKVLVLKDGRVSEFGAPAILLTHKRSFLNAAVT